MAAAGGDRIPARRGSVAVICPFRGSPAEAAEVLARLRRISLAADDRLVLVENGGENLLGSIAGASESDVRVVWAPAMQSSYYARNVGAESIETEWLLFIDADCVPVENILDEYFAEPPPDECGAVAGGVSGASFQHGLLTRYARDRGVLDQERFTHSERPFAATVNLLVRRSAWQSIGGFCEGIRSGGDVDFTWRLQAAGWTLDFRPSARVEHVHRETFRGLLSQFVRYGTGRAWLQRRHPDAPRASTYTGILLAGPLLALGLLATGRFERAAFRGLDVSIAAANRVGRLLPNRSHTERRRGPAEVAILADAFPQPELIAACRLLASDDGSCGVEARRRSQFDPERLARTVPVAYREDDGALARLRDLAWLLATRPLRLLGALTTPRRDGSTLRQLAPTARRLAERPTRTLLVADAVPTQDARRLARLVGATARPLDSEPASGHLPG